MQGSPGRASAGRPGTLSPLLTSTPASTFRPTAARARSSRFHRFRVLGSVGQQSGHQSVALPSPQVIGAVGALRPVRSPIDPRDAHRRFVRSAVEFEVAGGLHRQVGQELARPQEPMRRLRQRPGFQHRFGSAVVALAGREQHQQCNPAPGRFVQQGIPPVRAVATAG